MSRGMMIWPPIADFAMLQETSQNLYRQLLAVFPPVKAYPLATLGTSAMPPDIAHFLEKVLLHRATFELEHLKSPWFRMDAPEISALFASLRENMEHHIQFPADDWAAALENATGIVLSYLIRPSHTLAGFVFGRQSEALAPEVVLRRMQYFLAYPYFTEILSAFLARKKNETLAKERCLDLFSQIDRRMVEGYGPTHWLSLLEPLFDIFTYINADGTPSVPTTLLAVFFQDKGEERLYRRLLFEGQIRQKGTLTADELRTFLNIAPHTDSVTSPANAVLGPVTPNNEEHLKPLDTLGPERDEPEPPETLGSERDEPTDALGPERDSVLPLASETLTTIEDNTSGNDPLPVMQEEADPPSPFAPEIENHSDIALPRTSKVAFSEEGNTIPLPDIPVAPTFTAKEMVDDEGNTDDIPVHSAEEVLAALIGATDSSLTVEDPSEVGASQTNELKPIETVQSVPSSEHSAHKMATGPIRMHNLLRETLGTSKDGANSVHTPHLQSPTLASTLRQPTGLPLWKQFNQKVPSERVSTGPTTSDPNLEAAMRIEPLILGFLSPERRTWFLRTLFNNSPAFYLELLEKLRQCKTWNEASEVIAIALFLKNNIDIYSEAAVVFTDTVETRFMQNKRSASNA
ncbi:MAG: hypothetical protein JNN12_05255 [Bacteroidetes Order II. Incertae sedis bacterium]|nr:hypothetical protein [Bacteroidetes Order II. bacterium]